MISSPAADAEGAKPAAAAVVFSGMRLIWSVWSGLMTANFRTAAADYVTTPAESPSARPLPARSAWPDRIVFPVLQR